MSEPMTLQRRMLTDGCWRMAASLRRAGFELTVYNRTAAKAERFAAEHGARVAATPAALAADAQLICTMVVDGRQVRRAAARRGAGGRAGHAVHRLARRSALAPRTSWGASSPSWGCGCSTPRSPGLAARARAAATLTIMVGGQSATSRSPAAVLRLRWASVGPLATRR